MDGECTVISVADALGQLKLLSPNAPFLALGQTIFWDEPMKAGLFLAAKRLDSERRFVAGVHDTDYFAKLPSGKRQPGKFKALPHNDTTTQGLWSAAGEFSSLFGSETVITKSDLHQGGLRFEAIARRRPNFLDEATEAWGWRGIVSTDDSPPITAELPLKQVFPAIQATLNWALDSSLECMTGEGRRIAEELADDMRRLVCEAQDALFESKPNPTLADLYRHLIPDLYSFVANADVRPESTATTELLRFNGSTATLPRFELLSLFVSEETRAVACACYDRAVHGGGQYELRRFGTGAIPFDLVVPGRGRGTIRVGRRAVIIMTPTPIFLSLKKPLTSAVALAEVIERKLGPDCVLVGKALTLIGMLAREFVFVFHEGASSYVKLSRKLHGCLETELGINLQLHPILRLRYNIWDALQVCCSWLRLPEPFQGPFGSQEVCAPSIAARWRAVAEEQNKVLERLGQLKRPVDLLGFLETQLGGSWTVLAEEYKTIHDELEAKTKDLLERRARRLSLYENRRQLKAQRAAAERASGEHFRASVFENTHPDHDGRRNLQNDIREIVRQIHEADREIRTLMHDQRELANAPDVLKMHDRRRSIEVEAELARLRLIRQAVIVSRGMRRASYRPSAWWFRLVCADGLWFRETVDSAECYLEPLT